MTYGRLPFLSEELRSFPFVRLSNDKNSSCSTKVRVWIQGAAHGDEPGSDQAVLSLLGALDANQTWTQGLLEKLDIMVLPRYNPDGVFYLQDTFATNLDPNRDHIKLARDQTRRIKETFNEFNPHIALDMHEYSATRQYGPYYHASDAMIAPSKNLNIHPDIRATVESLFVPQIGAALDDKGLRWTEYVTGTASDDVNANVSFTEAGSEARIGRNALGLTQTITLLSETRGITIADQHFQRRVATGLTIASKLLQIAADNAKEVYHTVESSRRHFTESREDIVVTDYSDVVTDKSTWFIDVASDDLIEAHVPFKSSTPKVANLTRSRPEAYIIPVAWHDVATRLKTLGLEMETLQDEYEGPAEVLTVETSTNGTELYEGAHLSAVTMSTNERHIRLPAGSFWVSTQQKNAALAFTALEPENVDSYVTFGIIPLVVGDEYPIFRIL